MTDKEIENFVNWLQSCTAKKFYSSDAEDLIFEFKNQALSQHDVIKSLPTNEDEWFDEHEAFVTSMKIDTNKTTYEHLQNAFYWFKKRYGGNVL